MAKKDFSGVDSSPVFADIAAVTQEAPPKKPRKEYTEEEAAKYRQTGATRGRKGAQLKRINLAFLDQNYEYAEIMSRVQGKSITEFVNAIIEEHAATHSDIYDRAKQFIADLERS